MSPLAESTVIYEAYLVSCVHHLLGYKDSSYFSAECSKLTGMSRLREPDQPNLYNRGLLVRGGLTKLRDD